jgi:hypothetical protein
MARRFLVALAATLMIFGAIMAGIWFATGPDAPSTTPLAPQALASLDGVQLVSTAGLIDLGRAPLSGVPTPEYVIVKDEPAAPPPPGSWESVPIFAPRRGGAVLDLEDLQPRLSDCFSPSQSARGGPVVKVKDAAPLQDEGATTLLLQLEVTGDELRIVDAPVESRGQATDGTISCAQSTLRGRTAPSAGLTAGRHRVRYVLQP